MDEALAYDEFREALATDTRARFDRFFHALLADCAGVGRIVEVPAGPGCVFEAAASPATVADLRALAVGLDFGELWPAFGEDDAFEDFRRYVGQWVGPVALAAERGSGLVVA